MGSRNAKEVENYIRTVKNGFSDIKSEIIKGTIIIGCLVVTIVSLLIFKVELRPFWVFSIAFVAFWFEMYKEMYWTTKYETSSKKELIIRLIACVGLLLWLVLNSYFTIFYIGMGPKVSDGTFLFIIPLIIIEIIIYCAMYYTYKFIIDLKKLKFFRYVLGMIASVMMLVLAFWISELIYGFCTSGIPREEYGEKYGYFLLELWQFFKFL